VKFLYFYAVLPDEFLHLIFFFFFFFVFRASPEAYGDSQARG